MSFTPFRRSSSTYSSLVIFLFLGALLTLTRFNGENVGVDHVVIQAVQGAVALIIVLMLVIIKLNDAGTYSEKPVGSTATIIYIDEHDMVYIEWSDGKLSSFSDKQVIH